jgi:PAT family beta-lactamase induction signal transducer AmpG
MSEAAVDRSAGGSPPVQEQTRRPLLWVPTLYFAEGLPFYFVATLAGLMYKDLGVGNDQIGHVTALLGLAWAFKPLWSPLLETVHTKKRVVVTCQGAVAVGMLLCALSLQTPLWFVTSVAVLALIAASAATHDVAADGLYIASLDARQQARFAGWQGAFFNAARFLATGGLAFLAGQLARKVGAPAAWGVVFVLAGGIMALVATYHAAVLPRSPNLGSREGGGVWQTLREVFADFARKPGIAFAILFILLFRAGDGQVQTIGPLFLRDAREAGGLGLGVDQIGLVYGTGGTIAFLAGSVCGGHFAAWLGTRRALPLLILAVNVPNIVFYFLGVAQPSSLAVIGAALSVEMFGYGFGFVGLILYIMQAVAPGRHQTAHYAIGTGVMQLGFMFFKAVSGDIEQALGYRDFFLWVMAAALPVFVMSFFVRLPSPSER